MKNFKNISKRLLVGISAVGLLSVMLSSCAKNSETNYYPPTALMTVIQASPDQVPLDFYLNTSKVNVGSINYADDIDYFKAYVGTRVGLFTQASTSTKVASDTVTLKQNGAYSLFLVNKVSSPQILFLNDSISKPTSGNASIRFVNVSPDAPAVDLAIKGGAVVVPNKAFKGYSLFAPIPGQTYSFEIRQAGTTTVLATLNNVTLSAGFIYTVWLRGLATPTNDLDKLTAGLITNAYYVN
ncbi:DUF4397 domain-containing protein [Mucilaginibacter sp.]|uniref:DUF4397 domain-containing protein n=1 Tax=Mucilaginibacter sp. TaxID=1882438 RepID=UPI003D0F11D8